MEQLVRNVFICLEDEINEMFNNYSLRACFGRDFGNGKFNVFTLCDFVTLYRIQYLLLHKEIEPEQAMELLNSSKNYEALKSYINHNPQDELAKGIKIDCEIELSKKLPLIFDLKSYVESYDPTFDESVSCDDDLLQRTYIVINRELKKCFEQKTLQDFLPGKKSLRDFKHDFSNLSVNDFLTLYKIQLLLDEGTIPTKEQARALEMAYNELLSLERAISYIDDAAQLLDLEKQRANKLTILNEYGLPVSLNLKTIINSYRISDEALKNFQMVSRRQIKYDN